MTEKIMVGMSGGVDSSVCAALLQQQGYDVAGVTLLLCPNQTMQMVEDAKKIAEKLNIPHFTLDLREKFKELVIDDFAREYYNGRTPNPCIVCNENIKFGAMLNYAKSQGYSRIATGHYVQVVHQNGYYYLKRNQSKKDQSYFLYRLNQEQLKAAVFPLAEISKDETRKIAAELGLHLAEKKDSQEICFVENDDYAKFLYEYTGEENVPGDFILSDGTVVGEHQGLIHYTVGQRKGLGISLGKPMFVTRLIPESNNVVVGEEGTQYSASLIADRVCLTDDTLKHVPKRLDVKIRSQAQPEKALVELQEDGRLKIMFKAPQRSIALGQAAVLYENDLVLGGGRIIETFA